MGKIRIGRGKAMVEMDSTMHDIVARTLRNAYPAVTDRLEREAEELWQEARSAWPVKTGDSRDALDHGLRLLPPDKVESFVGIDPSSRAAEYAHLIKGKEQGGRQTWRVLIQAPGRARAKKLAESLSVELRKAAARG